MVAYTRQKKRNKESERKEKERDVEVVSFLARLGVIFCPGKVEGIERARAYRAQKNSSKMLGVISCPKKSF